MTENWVGISIVLLLLGGLIGALRIYKSRFDPHPEVVRKLLHVGMGLTSLTFPWLFDDYWPIIILVGVTTPGLYLTRHLKSLKTLCGGVIDGVGREQSLGEVYYPLGVATAFILSQGQPVLYCIPILLLTFADTAAALVGRLFGAIHYRIWDEVKSVEGSATFFVAAFFSIELALHFLTGIHGVERILIATLVAVIVMLVEAVAVRGLDNLLIPMVGFFLINYFIVLDQAELVRWLFMLCLTTVVVFIYYQAQRTGEYYV
ncbi:MAG: hypothetical protein AAF629_01010 [Chloroflexota bacterium]